MGNIEFRMSNQQINSMIRNLIANKKNKIGVSFQLSLSARVAIREKKGERTWQQVLEEMKGVLVTMMDRIL